MHKQPGIEIHFACQGYSTFYIEDQPYSHNKWSLIMFDASTPHRVISDGPFDRVVVLFAPDGRTGNMWLEMLVLEELRRSFPISLSFPSKGGGEEVKGLFLALADEFNNSRPARSSMLCGLLNQLIALIYRSYLGQNQQGSVLHRQLSWDRDPVAAVQEYIHQHLDESIQVSHLASVFNVSPEHLSRTFKRQTGLTVQQYVRMMRITKAQHLIAETNLPLTDIAEECGFKSLSHFSRVYKEVVGVPPSQWQGDK